MSVATSALPRRFHIWFSCSLSSFWAIHWLQTFLRDSELLHCFSEACPWNVTVFCYYSQINGDYFSFYWSSAHHSKIEDQPVFPAWVKTFKATKTFPLRLLFQCFLYGDCKTSWHVACTLKAYYLFNEDIVQTCSIPTVHPSVSCLNRALVFNGPINKQSKAIYRALFLLAVPAYHLILDVTLYCQTMGEI